MNEQQQEIADRVRKEATGEILGIEPDMNGVLVVQQLPTQPHPDLYRVVFEERVDGEQSLHWTYLGPTTHSSR